MRSGRIRGGRSDVVASFAYVIGERNGEGRLPRRAAQTIELGSEMWSGEIRCGEETDATLGVKRCLG